MHDHSATRASPATTSTSPFPTQQHRHTHRSHDDSADSSSAMQALSPPLTHRDNDHDHHDYTPSHQLSKDTCERRRPETVDQPRLVKMPADLVSQAVSPFLKEHIPGLYAPMNKQLHEDPATDINVDVPRTKDGNTKFCYRHRPDSKCRRAADETKMGIIQRVS